MHGQEERDACEVGGCTADKRDATRQRERRDARGTRGMHLNLKLKVVSFPDQVFMGHFVLQNSRNWTLFTRKLRNLEPVDIHTVVSNCRCYQ